MNDAIKRYTNATNDPIRIGIAGCKCSEPSIPETLAATIAGALKDQNFRLSR
jgi:hypothetical protein